MTVSPLNLATPGAPAPRRYLALWLPFLPTERRRREKRAPDGPFVVVEKIRGALRLYACDRRAASLGLTEGLTLADARARIPNLAAIPADAFADARLLERLAFWCEQFTPLAALDPPHGLALDITGCAQLFGGEDAMRAHILRRLAHLGFTARAALGSTPDAARAFARFSADSEKVEAGFSQKACDPCALPIAALEAPQETLIALRRAGLLTLGDLDARPSSALTARFSAALTEKLARIFGREDRRLTPLRAPAPYLVERRFAEPLIDLAGVEPALRLLFEDAAKLLEQRGEGGRAFEMIFFRTDAVTRRLVIETGKPARDPDILLRLCREKIDALKDPLNPGFGFDLIRLAVTRSEKFYVRQNDFVHTGAEDESAFDALIDRLAARFGRERVLRFASRDTHDPLRAGAYVYSDAQTPTPWSKPESGEPPLRPLSLFDPPQPIETIAETPDGPPIRFKWRRIQHVVARAEGPERIAPEWWRGGSEEKTRDYYRVEDRDGRRFWLYREGLYEREISPRWFLHGLFA